MRRILPLFAACFLALTISAFAAQPPVGHVRLVRGEPFECALKSINKNAVTFDFQGESRDVAVENLVIWGSYADRDRGPVILLADGGRLVADVVEMTDERLVVYSGVFDEVALPIEQVRGVVFRPPVDLLKRDLLFDKVQSAKGSQDQLLLDNGDTISGLIRSPADEESGDQPAEFVSIQLKGRDKPLKVPFENIAGLIFNPALVASSRRQAEFGQIGFGDGSRLNVEEAAISGEDATLVISGAVQLETDTETALEEITSIQTFNKLVTYVSDISSLGFKHIPFLDVDWTFANDRNVLGGQLRGDGKVFAKGLGMHSTSRLAYELDGDYREFQAELAIDQHAGSRGSVVFRLFTSGASGKWQAGYQSPIVRGGQSPLPISVDLRGIKRIALIVEFADRGDELDHANWLNARLLR